MTDYTELKRLAEWLIELNRVNLMDWAATIEDARIGKTHTEYALASNPAAVLALIAENEALRKHQPSAEVIWCECGDGHAANSYGAGFMDANGGVCANCDAAMGKGEQS